MFYTQEPSGDYLMELKIYNEEDVRGLDPGERWKHAITVIKTAYDRHSKMYRIVDELRGQCLTQAEHRGTSLVKKSKTF